MGWYRSEAPLTIAGAFRKEGDPADASPATAIELVMQQHS
jgi:hypothetical protein